jgi:PilZ domain
MDLSGDESRGIPRYYLTMRRDCPLGVIAFNGLEWTDHAARIVDMSVIGIGIESSRSIEPGLVWFKESVGGHRSGVLMWIKKEGPRYRAGIKFVPLSRDEEKYLQEQIGRSGPNGALEDPHHFISSIVASVRNQNLAS